MELSRPVESRVDRSSPWRRLSSFFFRHPALKLALQLAPGLGWLVVIYLGSLAALVSYSFRRIEGFTGLLQPGLSLDSYADLLDPANRDIIFRTTGMAAGVTVLCAIVAFPLAYYMARYASPRIKTALYLAVLMPLWSSYLVRVLAWRQILTREGIFVWVVDRLGLGGVLDFLLGVPGIGGESLAGSYLGMAIVFTYIWLPYMVLPLQAALERVPASFVEASSDLGARPSLTFRRVVLPLALPGLIAGSIFTFSLTLGDFIVPQVIGDSSFFIGVRVFQAVGVEGNLPLAAAFAVVPMVIMAFYLAGAKRTGAFEAL
jgi:putative spermidine/putrescine transport system permease protein